MSSSKNGKNLNFFIKMLFSNYFFLSFCLPSIPLDKISQEESRLFSKFVKDQCWQKVTQ